LRSALRRETVTIANGEPQSALKTAGSGSGGGDHTLTATFSGSGSG
jgi:hypothetical protein